MTRFSRAWPVLALVGVLAPASAQAKDRERFELSVRFEPLPNVGLQPESARLHLDLPVEMLPVRELWYGFDFDGRIREWNIPSSPSLRHSRSSQRAQASFGTSLQVDVEDPRRALRFRMALMPRLALAELSF